MTFKSRHRIQTRITIRAKALTTYLYKHWYKLRKSSCSGRIVNSATFLHVLKHWSKTKVQCTTNAAAYTLCGHSVRLSAIS